MTTRYDVLGIGNAIVDVIARTEDDFLVAQGMRKGGMALIDEARAAAIYAAMGPGTESSGGSAANTVVGVASFGARAAFIGKVKDDVLGRAFTHDIRAARVAFDTKPAREGPATARCYIMVTPDGERTMNTYLGAAQDLRPDDIDEAQVAGAAVVYLEGYLWDPPHAKQAFVKAAAIAHKNGRRVALTLSDAFCVDRYRAEFLDLIRNGTVDIVLPTSMSCAASMKPRTSTAARAPCSRMPSSRSSPAARRAAWWSAATAWKRSRRCRSKRWST